MHIFLASDHAGFELKSKLAVFLTEEGHSVTDLGPVDFNADDDYPEFIVKAAKEIAKNPEEVRGIIFGGSGQGEAMVANRVRGVRAAVYYGGSTDIVKLSREHNNANILSLGARFLTLDEAKKAVTLWLTTPFSSDARHTRRIAKIETVTDNTV